MSIEVDVHLINVETGSLSSKFVNEVTAVKMIPRICLMMLIRFRLRVRDQIDPALETVSDRSRRNPSLRETDIQIDVKKFYLCSSKT